MSLINLQQLGTVLNALASKIKNSRGNWDQNDPTADNYIQNRTHYEEYENVPVEKPLTITWNGNTDGKVQVFDSTSGESQPIFKISDQILTEEQFRGSTLTINGYTAPLANMWDDELANGNIICREDITAFMNPPFCAVRADNVNLNGLLFPKKGVYAYNDGGYYYSRIVTTYTGTEKQKVIHHLDPKYIKDMYYEDSTEVIETTIFPQETVVVESNTNGYPENTCVFEVGETYYIYYDDIVYECIAQNWSGWGIWVGNEKYLNYESNIVGMPFAVMVDENNGSMCLFGQEGTHTLRISIKNPKVYPLAEKYIPDTIARVSDITVLDGGSSPMTMPGLYTSDYDLIADWNTLFNVNGINLEQDEPEHYSVLNDTSFRYHIYKTYDDYADYDHKLSVSLPEGVQRIGDYVFAHISANEIVVPNSVEIIGQGAFYWSSGMDVLLRNNSQLSEIGNYAFYWTDIKQITIPSSVTMIGSSAFNYCTSLKTVYFEENYNLQEISSHLFYQCGSLESVNLENLKNLKTIGYYAFREAKALTSITIPATVTSIDDYAFGNCTSLKNVKVLAETPPTLDY